MILTSHTRTMTKCRRRVSCFFFFSFLCPFESLRTRPAKLFALTLVSFNKINNNHRSYQIASLSVLIGIHVSILRKRV